MARRTAGQIYRDLTAAGMSPAAAVTMTAIALAESGGDDTARGDLALQSGTWGPSYGLYQVRTLKADTGRGTTRDITHLAGSDAAQAEAAVDISRGGTDFSPWSTYTSGAYQRFLGTVSASDGITAAPAASLDPGSWAGDIAGNVRPLLLEGVAVILGLALVGAGLARAMGPRLRAAAGLATRGVL